MHSLNKEYIDIIVSWAYQRLSNFFKAPSIFFAGYVGRPHSMVSFPQQVIFAKWSEYARFAKPSGHTHRVARTLPSGYSMSQAFQLDVIGTLFLIS